MRKYISAKAIMMLIAAALIILTSCKKDPDPDPYVDPDPDAPKEIRILNNWIWEGMSDLYLWEKYLPDLNPDKQPDPKKFFYKLLFDDDRDSWIVDDYEALLARFDGVQLSTGISAYPGLIDDNEVITIVEYVTPNSPAADSGIDRGDIIYAIDGESLDTTNYFDLYYQTTATLEFANWNGTAIVPNGKKITLTAIELNQNPVVHSEVIDYQGHKIGYLVYTQFTAGQTNEWLTELNGVFEDFRSQGVSDVVVDLRYNGGGSLDLSAYIASTLGPATASQTKGTYVDLVWNDAMNQYWKERDLDGNGQPDGASSSQLVIKLPQSDLNLNLSRVYFLTTVSTASASESLMVGLYPYTEVIQIGTTTYGKCYGSVTIDDWEEPKRHNWAMQPIVLKYSNADGYTDFVSGIIPDFIVNESLLYAEPFGSYSDPLLAKALEEITGISPARKKSIQPEVGMTRLRVPRKPLPERIIDWPGRSGKTVLF